MAEIPHKKFRVGDTKDKDELLKRVPYKASDLVKREEPKVSSPPQNESPSRIQDSLNQEGSSGVKPAVEKSESGAKGLSDLEEDWKEHSDEKGVIRREDVGSKEADTGEIRDSKKVGKIIGLMVVLLILVVGGGAAGYFYSNPDKLSFVLPKKEQGRKGEIISPVPISQGGKEEVNQIASALRYGYVRDGDIYFDGRKVLEDANPSSPIYGVSKDKVAYLVSGEKEGLGFLRILNLKTLEKQDFPTEQVFLSPGMAVGPNGNKVALVTNPFGLRQIYLDSDEIQDLDESLELKVVGGDLKYTDDGKYLYYSLAINDGKDGSYTHEIWRVNLENDNLSSPVTEVSKVKDPDPSGVEFDILGNILVFIRDGELVVHDLEADAETFETAGGNSFTKVLLVGKKIVGLDGFILSVFDPSTGKEVKLDKEVSNFHKSGLNEMVLELKDGSLEKTDINMESFEVLEQDAENYFSL